MEIIAEAKSFNKTFEFNATIDEDGYVKTQYEIKHVTHPETKQSIPCVVVPSELINAVWGVTIPGDTVTIPLQDEKSWIALQARAVEIQAKLSCERIKKYKEAQLKKYEPFLRKAELTGERQLIEKMHSGRVGCLDSGSVDYLVTYANVDGTITSEEVKAEPKHY